MVGAEGCTALEEEGLANPSKLDSLVLTVYVPIPYIRTRPFIYTCFCSPEPSVLSPPNYLGLIDPYREEGMQLVQALKCNCSCASQYLEFSSISDGYNYFVYCPLAPPLFWICEMSASHEK